MRKTWIKEEWDGLVFRSEDTMETLSGEIMEWNGITMVTKLGLWTSEEISLPAYPRAVPNAKFLVTLTLFSQFPPSVLKSYKNKEMFWRYLFHNLQLLWTRNKLTVAQGIHTGQHRTENRCLFLTLPSGLGVNFQSNFRDSATVYIPFEILDLYSQETITVRLFTSLTSWTRVTLSS